MFEPGFLSMLPIIRVHLHCWLYKYYPYQVPGPGRLSEVPGAGDSHLWFADAEVQDNLDISDSTDGPEGVIVPLYVWLQPFSRGILKR